MGSEMQRSQVPDNGAAARTTVTHRSFLRILGNSKLIRHLVIPLAFSLLLPLADKLLAKTNSKLVAASLPKGNHLDSWGDFKTMLRNCGITVLEDCVYDGNPRVTSDACIPPDQGRNIAIFNEHVPSDAELAVLGLYDAIPFTYFPIGDTTGDTTARDSILDLLDRPCEDATGREIPLPKNFNLYQNYPNPFNPITTISYSVPKTAHVTLRVFDITGRTVATLVNGRVEPGTHAVTFNGSDLPSGIYFYQVVTEGFGSTKKMILLK